MDQTDITTPNPCILTIEEQNQFLAFLRKFNIKLGTIHLPTAPAGNPFGATGLGSNLQIKATKLDTIQDIQTISTPQFAKLGLTTPAQTGYDLYLNGVGLKGDGSGRLGINITSTLRTSLDVTFGTANTGSAISGAGCFNASGSITKVNAGQGIILIESTDSAVKDSGGTIVFGGRAITGNTIASFFAAIIGAKENNTSSNFASYLAFFTNISTWTPTERMRIDSSGYIGINTIAPTKRFSISEKYQIDDNGLPVKSNNIPLVGQGNALIVGIGGTTSSGAIANITSFVIGGTTSFFEIGGYINVTAFTAGTISMFCTYTDPSGNAQTLTIPLVSLAGTPVTTVGSLTDAQALVTSIVALNGTTITIGTTVSLFTGTYNAYAWIKQIA